MAALLVGIFLFVAFDTYIRKDLLAVAPAIISGMFALARLANASKTDEGEK